MSDDRIWEILEKLRAVSDTARVFEEVQKLTAPVAKFQESTELLSKLPTGPSIDTSTLRAIRDATRVLDAPAFRVLSELVSARRCEELREDGVLEKQGRIVEPDNTILTPEEIFGAWKVESSSLMVEAGTVPLAVMQELMRDPEGLRRLDSRQFEFVVAEILSRHGFDNVKVTRKSGDGGKDITAHRILAGIPISFYFECRQHGAGKPVRLDELRALLGVVSKDGVSKGVLVTTSRFTEGGKEFIAENARVDGKDYEDLVGWIEQLKV